MKKVSRQQCNKERSLDRRDGLRIPKHQPTKRTAEKRDVQRALRTLDQQ